MVNYDEIKEKHFTEQLREAQLAVSDLLEMDTWKAYERKVIQGDNEAEKMIITRIKTFASNRPSRDLIYKLAEEADSIRIRLKKGKLDLSCDEALKREIYKALSKYVGIVAIVEAGE